MNADKLYGRGHHGHNVHYLSTAYAFSGQFDKAMESAKQLLEFKENPREASQIDGFFNVYRQGWFAMLRALVQAEKWDDILAGQTLPAYGKPREKAWYAWARGVAFAAKGDARAAADEARNMDAALKEFREKVGRGPSEELLTARLELDGHVAAAKGKSGRAMKTLQRAMDRERALVYSEPPYYPRPVAMAMGQLAAKLNQPDRARRAFEIALEQYPDNAHAKRALNGLAKPASASE